ncbi:hypothetical protein WAJ21_20995, partial [Acinetobacter baumannii]
RACVLRGTAEKAGFAELPHFIFGKTGTSTASNRFRTQGWFVGFVARGDTGEVAPEEVELVVLVFLKRAHGVEAAAVARAIIAEYVEL